MRKDWSKELDTVTFRCGVCRHTWDAAPDLVEPDDEVEHHPFAYFATCPVCDANHQPMAPWVRGLMKAHQSATGPRSTEGKAATAANLVGHPTREEALRTRFNAMKHGLSARTASYFPAKPDGYSFCKNCDVDRYWCAEQPACVKQTEHFMLHHAAFEQRNPKILSKVHADLHAALVGSLQMCLQSLLGRGAELVVPKVQLDSNGRCVTLQYADQEGNMHPVLEVQANPLFKPIVDLVTRLGLSLTDLGMTVKAAEEDDGALRGRLSDAQAPGEVLDAFTQRMAAALEKIPGLLKDSAADVAADPVLLEHQAATGDAGAPAGQPAARGGRPR